MVAGVALRLVSPHTGKPFEMSGSSSLTLAMDWSASTSAHPSRVYPVNPERT
jgi:hypothetical protein